MEVPMRKLLVIGASLAGLLAGTAATSSVWSQTKLKTCSEAHSACTSQTKMKKECEAELGWCKQTGSFADPKTKAVTSGLQKR
jgi:hypothetical protein